MKLIPMTDNKSILLNHLTTCHHDEEKDYTHTLYVNITVQISLNTLIFVLDDMICNITLLDNHLFHFLR